MRKIEDRCGEAGKVEYRSGWPVALGHSRADGPYPRSSRGHPYSATNLTVPPGLFLHSRTSCLDGATDVHDHGRSIVQRSPLKTCQQFRLHCLAMTLQDASRRKSSSSLSYSDRFIRERVNANLLGKENMAHRASVTFMRSPSVGATPRRTIQQTSRKQPSLEANHAWRHEHGHRVECSQYMHLPLRATEQCSYERGGEKGQATPACAPHALSTPATAVIVGAVDQAR